MWFEINVSLNGVHFFATSERSITTAARMSEVYRALFAALPPDRGYKITVTKWETVGKTILHPEGYA